MNILIDIDGLLTIEEEGYSQEAYRNRTPNLPNIEILKHLKHAGHVIILFSARFPEDMEITRDWLRRYEVPYDQIILGKPHAHVYVDPRTLPYIESEMAHYYYYSLHHSCWRYRQGREVPSSENHPCFFCGESISLTLPDCEKCGIIKCPYCGKCQCNIPLISQITLARIHKKYCCNLPDFKGKIELTGFVDADVIRHATKAITNCFKECGL